MQRSAKPPHAAVHVMDRGREHEPCQHRKERISDPAMQWWHRAGKHRSSTCRQATSLDEIVPQAELLEKRGDLPEIVAVVCITHDDIPASRGCNPAHERSTIPSSGNVDDPCTHSGRDFAGAVGAAVISHDEFARNLLLLEHPLSFQET